MNEQSIFITAHPLNRWNYVFLSSLPPLSLLVGNGLQFFEGNWEHKYESWTQETCSIAGHIHFCSKNWSRPWFSKSIKKTHSSFDFLLKTKRYFTCAKTLFDDFDLVPFKLFCLKDKFMFSNFYLQENKGCGSKSVNFQRMVSI